MRDKNIRNIIYLMASFSKIFQLPAFVGWRERRNRNFHIGKVRFEEIVIWVKRLRWINEILICLGNGFIENCWMIVNCYNGEAFSLSFCHIYWLNWLSFPFYRLTMRKFYTSFCKNWNGFGFVGHCNRLYKLYDIK